MNVLIATDDPRTCTSLMGLLDQQTGITARTCGDVHTLQRQVCAACPDLVLLDWELTGRPPAALLFALDRAACGPNSARRTSQWTTGRWPTGRWPAVIVLSEHAEVEPVALACGASAFVHKHEAHTALNVALHRLLER